MGIGWELSLVVVLIAVNAVFAGSEIALLRLRKGQVRRLARRSGAGRLVARLADDPNRYLATVQIGITLAGFLASATAAVTLAAPVADVLRPWGALARPTAIVAVTAALTFCTLVWGELAPKRLAMLHPERWALTVARPLSALATLARPVVWALATMTDATISLIGGTSERSDAVSTRDEIADLLSTTDSYTPAERRVIVGAVEATERTLREVLRPRLQVVALSERTSADTAVDQLVDAAHTRAPVFREQLDDADRVVSLLDLVRSAGTVADAAQAAVILPESMPLIEALRTMQVAHQELALVVSEHGGVDGLVTVEDLVEELVGEIYDRHDAATRSPLRYPDGSFTIAGHFPVHELVDIDVELPAGEYVTLAGLVLDRLGRLPIPGDHVDLEGWRITVLSVHDHAIRQVRLAPMPRDDEDPERG